MPTGERLRLRLLSLLPPLRLRLRRSVSAPMFRKDGTASGIPRRFFVDAVLPAALLSLSEPQLREPGRRPRSDIFLRGKHPLSVGMSIGHARGSFASRQIVQAAVGRQSRHAL